MNIKLLFLLPLLLSGCAKQKKLLKPAEKAPTFYKKIFVKDIECQYCAQTAVARLEKLQTVTKSDFVCKNNNWEKGYLRIYSTEELPDEIISQELSKDGFGIIIPDTSTSILS